MNMKRFVLSCVCVFVFVYAFDWFLHSFLLHDMYVATKALWRTKKAMPNYIIWVMLGELLMSVMFCFIFVKGYENRGLMEGVRYGLYVGLLLSAHNFIIYAVQPISFVLMASWIVARIVQMMLAGVVVASVYRN